MIDLKGYTPTIGIECHVQLKTRTKLFVGVSNNARDAEPNTLISHVCLGMPGALPVLNAQAVELAIRAAFALGVAPQMFSKFDRKHYFYPDLPKGYQISQFDEPIILGGEVLIDVDGTKKTIGVTRAHLEEDAGKSTHPEGADYSLVDLNRAGTPLLEIVSEPDIHTAAEARAYAKELWLRMRYAGVSDADLYHGNMRFDVNVSVSRDLQKLGTRSETKNLNSFKSVEKAVEYEIKRQIDLLENGGEVVQETRGWDDAKARTFSQRTKEDAHDYRYFPDPDLPPIMLDMQHVDEVKRSMPVMPQEWRDKLLSLGLDVSQTESLIEGELEIEDTALLELVEESMDTPEKAKFIANWIVNVTLPLIRENKYVLNNKDHSQLLQTLHTLINAKKLSSTAAKSLYAVVCVSSLPKDLTLYASEKGYIQVSDESEIEKIVLEVIEANESAAQDVRGGELKAIGFLVGQVMKASKGKANPSLAQSLLKKHLF